MLREESINKKEEATTVENQTFFQLNFLRIKGEDLDVFKTTRKRYMEKREGITDSRVMFYQSFFSFPKRNARGAFIELIEWRSIEESEAINQALAEADETSEYHKTFTLEATFRMYPEEKDSFDMEKLLHNKQAIEFAVRQIKPSKRKVYPRWRKVFLDNITTKRGYEFDAEFVSIDEDINILLFGWDSVESFEQAGKEVRRSPIVLLKLMKYFSLIRSRVFQVGKLVEG